MSLLGSYAHPPDPRLLGAPDHTHARIVSDLTGRRLSVMDEPRPGFAAPERLMQLTRGSPLTGRAMRGNPATFRPTHTLVLTTNEDSALIDPALRGRARLIPCTGDPGAVHAARAAIGPLHGPAWQAEAPGVLATMTREAALWLADPHSADTAAAPASIRHLADTPDSLLPPVPRNEAIDGSRR